VIYPGLKKWMKENRIRPSALQGILTPNNPHGRVKQKLTGESKFSITDIKRIIKASGLSFEELFLTNDELEV
jgi:hypothetical protein